jgi:hypothetical protein
MLSGSKLDDLTIIANDAESMKATIVDLFNKSFTREDIKERKELLGVIYNNGNNIDKLIDLFR